VTRGDSGGTIFFGTGAFGNLEDAPPFLRYFDMADLEQITETAFCCPLSHVSLGKPGQFIKSNGFSVVS
jgi:hypothetical protein